MAVAAILFRRPGKTRELLQSLKRVQPPRIYLIADGPRTGRVGEAELCAETRKVAEEGVTWTCEVIRLYSAVNLGLRKRMESGLDFLFQHEDFAVILEDDCSPSADFFRFCEHGNDHYAADQHIGAVSGNCYLPATVRLAYSYYYSRYPHCWGWATWKSRWQNYQRSALCWPGYRTFFPKASSREAKYWDRIYARLELFDSWAYRWQAHFWQQGYLCLYPGENLVDNTGFGPDSTHTRDVATQVRWERQAPMKYPLIRPERVVPNEELDLAVFQNGFLKMEGRRNLWQKLRDRCLRHAGWKPRTTTNPA